MDNKIKPGFFEVVDELLDSSPTEKKIKSFKEFQDGWCYGDGIEFSNEIIKQAIKLNKLFIDHDFFITNAFPGANGEIMVSLYEDIHYFQFIIEPSGSIEYLREDNSVKVGPRKKDLNFEAVKDIIVNFKEERWHTFAGLNVIGTTEEEGNLTNWPSEKSEEEYLYLEKIAS
jgi:hypothetical protein